MLTAYHSTGEHLQPLPATAPLQAAQWIDLASPDAAETAAIAGFVPEVPTLEDMREIEISNRLYREGSALYLTVIIPGQNALEQHVSGPVTFILTPERLLSLRYHTPRPFETYPAHAGHATPGCATPAQILLGMMEEITGRQADLLEGVAVTLDEATAEVYRPDSPSRPGALQAELRRIGLQGELIGRVRLGLLTLARALSFLKQAEPGQFGTGTVGETVTALVQDITALEVHADFLTQRIAMTNDVIVGLITIGQAQTTKIVSVIAVLFLPPTLIASIYGMNFEVMPELAWRWGYPAALGGMVLSALGTLALFKWLRWL